MKETERERQAEREREREIEGGEKRERGRQREGERERQRDMWVSRISQKLDLWLVQSKTREKTIERIEKEKETHTTIGK